MKPLHAILIFGAGAVVGGLYVKSRVTARIERVRDAAATFAPVSDAAFGLVPDSWGRSFGLGQAGGKG